MDPAHVVWQSKLSGLSIHSSRKGRPGICACCPVWFVDNGDGQTLLELAFSTSNVPEAAMEVDMGQ